jgi:hypothetical protein
MRVIFRDSRGSTENWLEPKIKPPSGNFFPKSAKRSVSSFYIGFCLFNIKGKVIIQILKYRSVATVAIIGELILVMMLS